MSAQAQLRLIYRDAPSGQTAALALPGIATLPGQGWLGSGSFIALQGVRSDWTLRLIAQYDDEQQRLALHTGSIIYQQGDWRWWLGRLSSFNLRLRSLHPADQMPTLATQVIAGTDDLHGDGLALNWRQGAVGWYGEGSYPGADQQGSYRLGWQGQLGKMAAKPQLLADGDSGLGANRLTDWQADWPLAWQWQLGWVPSVSRAIENSNGHSHTAADCQEITLCFTGKAALTTLQLQGRLPDQLLDRLSAPAWLQRLDWAGQWVWRQELGQLGSGREGRVDYRNQAQVMALQLNYPLLPRWRLSARGEWLQIDQRLSGLDASRIGQLTGVLPVSAYAGQPQRHSLSLSYQPRLSGRSPWYLELGVQRDATRPLPENAAWAGLHWRGSWHD